MACDPIVVSRFKQLKPQFSSIPDTTVEEYIDVAQIWVSSSLDGIKCETAQAAVTCHLLTIDGLGTDAESKSFKSGHVHLQSVRSASVSFTRFKDAAENAGRSTVDWFSQTKCGRLFLAINRGASGGPIVAQGGVAVRGVTGYARDAWWP